MSRKIHITMPADLVDMIDSEKAAESRAEFIRRAIKKELGIYRPTPVASNGRCGRVMYGSGDDTYDPTCDLRSGHDGSCKSRSAIDQCRLVD
jgi:hypothetical protein